VRARQRKRALLQRPTARGDFTGTANVVYHEARSRCLVLPPSTLRRAYQAKSGDPADVARAFAEREAPTPSYRKASYEGCLDGLDSRP
jgi:hypothetical protein